LCVFLFFSSVNLNPRRLNAFDCAERLGFLLSRKMKPSDEVHAAQQARNGVSGA